MFLADYLILLLTNSDNFKCVNNINWCKTYVSDFCLDICKFIRAMGANSSRTDVSLLSDDDGKCILFS